jgi:hypothetical protein
LLTLRKGGVAKTVKNRIVSSSAVLVAVTDWAGLVVPMTTLPKLSWSGLTRSCSSFSPNADAIPGVARLIAKRRAKIRAENAKMDDFGRDMVNPPMKQRCRDERVPKTPTTPPTAEELADSVSERNLAIQ